MVEFDNMINKKLDSVELSDDKETITFKFADGLKRKFGVEGNCYSSSWIEHLTTPDTVGGAVLVSVEESGGVPWDGHDCDKVEKDEYGSPVCGHDSLQVYNTRFRTDRGDIVLEYRNDSNGYYGGYLVDCD